METIKLNQRPFEFKSKILQDLSPAIERYYDDMVAIEKENERLKENGDIKDMLSQLVNSQNKIEQHTTNLHSIFNQHLNPLDEVIQVEAPKLSLEEKVALEVAKRQQQEQAEMTIKIFQKKTLR